MTIQATSCVSFHNLTIKKSVHFNLSFICWLKVLIIFAFSFIFYYLFINFLAGPYVLSYLPLRTHMCVCVLVTQLSLALCFLTRDQTQAPCSESLKSWLLDGQGSPPYSSFKVCKIYSCFPSFISDIGNLFSLPCSPSACLEDYLFLFLWFISFCLHWVCFYFSSFLR